MKAQYILYTVFDNISVICFSSQDDMMMFEQFVFSVFVMEKR